MKIKRTKVFFSVTISFLLVLIIVGYIVLACWCTEQDAYFQDAETYPISKLRFLQTKDLVELTLHTWYYYNSSYAPSSSKEYYDLWKESCNPLQELEHRTDAAETMYDIYLKEKVLLETFPREFEKRQIIDINFDGGSRWWLQRERLYSLELLLSQDIYQNRLSEAQQKIITKKVAENRRQKKEWSRNHPECAYHEPYNWWEQEDQSHLVWYE